MIKKIISGGQTGADQGALDAAIEMGFPHGGWIPKGRLTENGPLPDRYQLIEMPTGSYKKRTEKNVVDSDGTLLIGRGHLSGGTRLTRIYADDHRKPNLYVNLKKTSPQKAAETVYAWICRHNIEVLNVAGPRASKDPNIYEDVKFIIQGVLTLAGVDATAGTAIENDIDAASLK